MTETYSKIAKDISKYIEDLEKENKRLQEKEIAKEFSDLKKSHKMLADEIKRLYHEDPYLNECTGCRGSHWGTGAVDDPLSNAAGGKPWSPCFEEGCIGWEIDKYYGY